MHATGYQSSSFRRTLPAFLCAILVMLFFRVIGRSHSVLSVEDAFDDTVVLDLDDWLGATWPQSVAQWWSTRRLV